jgi:hypothetical protein
MRGRLFPNVVSTDAESDGEVEDRAGTSLFERRKRSTARSRPSWVRKQRPPPLDEHADTPPTSPSPSGAGPCNRAPEHGAGTIRHCALPSPPAFQGNHTTPTSIAQHYEKAFRRTSTLSFWLCILAACLVLLFMFGFAIGRGRVFRGMWILSRRLMPGLAQMVLSDRWKSQPVTLRLLILNEPTGNGV